MTEDEYEIYKVLLMGICEGLEMGYIRRTLWSIYDVPNARPVFLSYKNGTIRVWYSGESGGWRCFIEDPNVIEKARAELIMRGVRHK